MTGKLFSWFRTRSPREQRLLLAMAALMLAVLAWLLVIRPLGDALAEAKLRHAEAVIALAGTRAQADAIRAAEKHAPPPLSAPLDAVLGQAAAEAGFPVTRIDRQSTAQATLVLETVRPQAFFGWVGQMEQGRGLIVERLTATPNSDHTLAVQVSFRERSN